MIGQDVLASWRGFNLREKFIPKPDGPNPPFVEAEFKWMAAHGFNFARLPLSYHVWSSRADWRKLDESQLRDIDDAVAMGRANGIHVNINFHRIPGYFVGDVDPEPLNLFKDDEALEAACYHWSHFAQRYAGEPADVLSFNLINEPAGIDTAQYVPVVAALADAIRRHSPNRPIFVDGVSWGNQPVAELAGRGLIHSCRGYRPTELTHYGAHWIKAAEARVPTWPMVMPNGHEMGGAELNERFKPWADLQAMGEPVHCGEWGCYHRTPHSVFLHWATDLLTMLGRMRIGWALWNLGGRFGVFDSEREDVTYQKQNGRLLDRQLLDLLLAH